MLKADRVNAMRISTEIDAVGFHDRLADRWDLQYNAGAFMRRASLVMRLLDALSLEGQTWLDAGCGSGYFSRALADRGAKVLGVDASSSMIDRARHLADVGGRGRHISFEKVDSIERIEWDSESFHGALCLSVLEYLPDPARALREMARLLKRDGVMLISIPHRFSPVRRGLQLLHNVGRIVGTELFGYLDLSVNAYTFASFADELKEAGLEITGSRSFDPFLPKWSMSLVPGSLMFVTVRRMK
jgi:2-polyprenyl-3-methyl-5-hydroxy-6-metoxy-1,4-benzoquinol methylase